MIQVQIVALALRGVNHLFVPALHPHLEKVQVQALRIPDAFNHWNSGNYRYLACTVPPLYHAQAFVVGHW